MIFCLGYNLNSALFRVVSRFGEENPGYSRGRFLPQPVTDISDHDNSHKIRSHNELASH